MESRGCSGRLIRAGDHFRHRCGYDLCFSGSFGSVMDCNCDFRCSSIRLWASSSGSPRSSVLFIVTPNSSSSILVTASSSALVAASSLIICNFLMSSSCRFKAATLSLSISWNLSYETSLAALAIICALIGIEKLEFLDLLDDLLRRERFE